MKDKLFFFFNYEFLNQVQAISIQPTGAAFAPLNNTYGSPYAGKQISLRFDYHLSSKHTLFLRYSHDGNHGFGQALSFGDPANWPLNTNWADQSIIGLTSSITPTIVNDIRFQYNYWNNHNYQADSSLCSLPCVAGGTVPNLFGGSPLAAPNIFTFLGSNMPAVGPNFNAPQGRNTRRYELVESLSWQKGAHRFKFGGDLNPTNSAGLWGFCTPMCVGAFSPDYTRAVLVPALGQATFNALFPTLPTVLHSDADALNLPGAEHQQQHLQRRRCRQELDPRLLRLQPEQILQSVPALLPGRLEDSPEFHLELWLGLERADRILQFRSASPVLPIADSRNGFGQPWANARTTSRNSSRLSVSPGARSRTTRPSSAAAAVSIGTARRATTSCVKPPSLDLPAAPAALWPPAPSPTSIRAFSISVQAASRSPSEPVCPSAT